MAHRPHNAVSDPCTPDARDPADLPLMRRVAVAMYLVGGISAYLILLAPDPDSSDHVPLALLGGVLLASAALLALVRTPPFWLLRLSPLWGIVVVSAIVAIARPTGGTPFFFLWPVMYCAYFNPRRDLAAALVLLCASFGIALAAWVPAGIRVILYFDAVVTIALVAILVMFLRERMKRLLAQLRRSATTDPLTGLLNRGGFETAFARELARAKRSGLELSLALFDLDFFKQVNDRLGHAGGDSALRRFAALLVEDRRDGDIVARIGGEEFAVLLFDADVADARRYARRVAARLQEATAGTEVRLAVSAGISTLEGDATTADSLLLRADKALYSAKKAGRRRVAVWDGDMTLTAHEPGSELAGALGS